MVIVIDERVPPSYQGKKKLRKTPGIRVGIENLKTANTRYIINLMFGGAAVERAALLHASHSSDGHVSPLPPVEAL